MTNCCVNLATSAIRLIVFVFNIIIVVLGLSLFVLGIIYLVRLGPINKFQYVAVAPTLGIVLGGLMFLVGFLGCCGALKENRFMLQTYSTILVVLLILEIIVCVFSFLLIDRSLVKILVTNEMKTEIQFYEINPRVRKYFDDLQTSLNCCGVETAYDYKNTLLPSSCCDTEPSLPPQCSLLSPNLYNIPCGQKVDDMIDLVGKVFGIITFVIGIVMVFGLLFGFFLSYRVNEWNVLRKSNLP